MMLPGWVERMGAVMEIWMAWGNSLAVCPSVVYLLLLWSLLKVWAIFGRFRLILLGYQRWLLTVFGSLVRGLGELSLRFRAKLSTEKSHNGRKGVEKVLLWRVKDIERA